MAKFNIEVKLNRREKGHRNTTYVWTRYFARIATAVRGCTEYLVEQGEVGDVVELLLRTSGYQVGTIRLMATGKLDVQWNHNEFLKDFKKTQRKTCVVTPARRTHTKAERNERVRMAVIRKMHQVKA